MNRHTRRHVEKAILNGEPVKEKYKKYVERIRSKMAISLNAPDDLPSASPVPDAEIDVVSNVGLGFMTSPLAAAGTSTYIFPETTSIATESHVFEQPQSQQIGPVDTCSNETSTYIPPETTPIATEPHVFEQPQSQQIGPVDTCSHDHPTGSSSGALELDQSRSQMEDEYLVVMKRMEQLAPILAKVQRTLSLGEIMGVISYIVCRRDGFSPDRFFA
jgi:hypothetical protein